MPDHEATDWTHIHCDPAAKTDRPFPTPAVQTQDAAEAMKRVLDEVGATLPKRDATDARDAEKEGGIGSEYHATAQSDAAARGAAFCDFRECGVTMRVF